MKKLQEWLRAGNGRSMYVQYFRRIDKWQVIVSEWNSCFDALHKNIDKAAETALQMWSNAQ